jgi:CRP-like cAMP-binding protein
LRNSVIKGEPLRYEVVTLQKSRLCFLPRATFLRLLRTSLPFNHFIIGQLNARLGQFIALIESSRSRDTLTQVARCLAEIFNPHLNPRPELDIHISQQEIGRLCGLSRQVASRALHRLEDEGLVQMHHNHVQVLDISRLQHFLQLH